MIDYLESIKSRDPAAKSLVSIILTYPGVKAVFFHKIANFFNVCIIYGGRSCSEISYYSFDFSFNSSLARK